MQRRFFLKSTLASSAVMMAASSGLLVPGQVLAEWNKAAFDATDVQSAMKGAVGSDLTDASDKIKIKAPDIAENGAVVPVTISSTLPDVKSITILSEKNGTPLIAKYNLGATSEAFVSTRIKMGKTSNIIAICESGGKLYSARKEVKVTIGGCGG
jgi:sulfur-oxidizing protein SoxY